MAGLEALVAVADVIQRVREKAKDIESLFDESRELADLIAIVQQICVDLEEQLLESKHRGIIESLRTTLEQAENIVDFINEHPKYSAIRSGFYKQE